MDDTQTENRRKATWTCIGQRITTKQTLSWFFIHEDGKAYGANPKSAKGPYSIGNKYTVDVDVDNPTSYWPGTLEVCRFEMHPITLEIDQWKLEHAAANEEMRVRRALKKANQTALVHNDSIRLSTTLLDLRTLYMEAQGEPGQAAVLALIIRQVTKASYV